MNNKRIVVSIFLATLIAPRAIGSIMESAQAAIPRSKDKRRDKAIQTAVTSAAKTFMENQRTVCLSIGIYDKGTIRFYNFCAKDRKEKHLPTEHTRYPIASISKTFTGILLAKAVIEGKANLNDDVRKYLRGDYPNLEYHGQPIRLWQLINHTSGLPMMSPIESEALKTVQNDDMLQKAVREAKFVESYSSADFYRDLHDVKLTRNPGERFSYSGFAAQLLGLTLERIYGESYEELVRNEITGPLKMKDTKIRLTPEETARLPRGYVADEPFLWPLSVTLPAASSIYSTASDMLKYVAWNLSERDEAVNLSHKPAGNTIWSEDGGYAVGLNWQIETSSGIRKIFQDGSVPGYHCLCIFYPELKIGIIALTNETVNETQTHLSSLANEMMKAIDPKAFE